MHGENLKLM